MSKTTTTTGFSSYSALLLAIAYNSILDSIHWVNDPSVFTAPRAGTYKLCVVFPATNTVDDDLFLDSQNSKAFNSKRNSNQKQLTYQTLFKNKIMMNYGRTCLFVALVALNAVAAVKQQQKLCLYDYQQRTSGTGQEAMPNIVSANKSY